MARAAVHQNSDELASQGRLTSPPSLSNVSADEPWLTIRWDSGRRCVHAEWKGFANSAQFRAGSMSLLKAIQETDATSTVNDTRKLEVVSHEDQLAIIRLVGATIDARLFNSADDAVTWVDAEEKKARTATR